MAEANVILTIKEIEDEAPQFIQAVEDAITLAKDAQAAVAGKSGLGLIEALPQLAAPAEKVYTDIITAYNAVKAVGAAQATAKMTPPVSETGA